MRVLTESMTKLQIHELTIRCWRQEDFEVTAQVMADNENEIIAAYNDLPENQEFSFQEIAIQLLALPNMNAVEVLDENGKGVVVYRDWP